MTSRALGEGDFLPNLRQDIPLGLLQRRGDEFGADVAFREGLLVNGFQDAVLPLRG